MKLCAIAAAALLAAGQTVLAADVQPGAEIKSVPGAILLCTAAGHQARIIYGRDLRAISFRGKKLIDYMGITVWDPKWKRSVQLRNGNNLERVRTRSFCKDGQAGVRFSCVMDLGEDAVGKLLCEGRIVMDGNGSLTVQYDLHAPAGFRGGMRINCRPHLPTLAGHTIMCKPKGAYTVTKRFVKHWAFARSNVTRAAIDLPDMLMAFALDPPSSFVVEDGRNRWRDSFYLEFQQLPQGIKPIGMGAYAFPKGSRWTMRATLHFGPKPDN